MTLVKYTEIFHPNELGAVSQEKRAVAPATGLVTASAPSPRFVQPEIYNQAPYVPLSGGITICFIIFSNCYRFFLRTTQVQN